MKEKHFDKTKVSYTISEEVHNAFREACRTIGVKMSPRLELLLKKDTGVLNRIGEEMKQQVDKNDPLEE